jgi:hypothetical protein
LKEEQDESRREREKLVREYELRLEEERAKWRKINDENTARLK